MGSSKRFRFRRVNAIWFGFTWDATWTDYLLDLTVLLPLMELSIGIGRKRTEREIEERTDRLWNLEASDGE